MLKFIRGKGQQPSAERQKLQKELFAFRKTVQHGFPNKPTCLAWDPELRIMAIGTATGAIKVLGQPGVEFYGHHSSNEIPVTKLIFVPNQGRLISLCDDNSLHLWEINGPALEEPKTLLLEGKLKKISALCLDGHMKNLLLGTEGGNVYLLNLNTFQMDETVIFQDVVMKNVPEDYKLNPGAVEAMAIQPGNPDHLLIGYNRGLMVIWDMKSPDVVQTCINNQGIESVCWRDGQTFFSSHNDGSYAQWSTTFEEHREPNTVYGPFPCKAITKIIATEDNTIIFSGGMQRASYSDRHTISVLCDDRNMHVVLDFTSKVVDFFVAPSEDDSVLIVLAEEELVAVQLNREDTPMLQLPYLVSLHASVVTCSTYVSDLSQPLWDDIVAAGNNQSSEVYSEAAWPVDGGRILEGESETPKRRDLLLTGHEDGSVRLWDAASVAMVPLYKFSSSRILSGEEDDDIPREQDPDEQDQEEWPPFKKVGCFDPYSDDPRLAVKKVFLCPESGYLVVAGTAGHVIVAKLTSDPEPDEIKVTTMNIVSSRDEFVWKGHQALKIRPTPTPLLKGGGFAASSILQLHPPAAVTALAVHSGWGLLAAGTAHGVAIFDFIKLQPVTVKCTLNPLDMAGAGEGPISRRKSFKKSLRESFRRLRKGRSQRGDKRGQTTTGATISPPSATSPASGNEIETKPVERAIEARPVDDGMGSMVRCLTFARTYLVSLQTQTPTLWVGTNNGTVYVFSIGVPAGAKRKDENVICQLGKEIQLKHRAPVIGISLMDGRFDSVDGSRTADHPGPHKVLICSEEQLKVFTVPQLKPSCKLKLTAIEGARVRKTILALFLAGSSHTETCLLCLTNLGDMIILSLPDLRRQMNAAVIKKEDINGISSLCFTERGEALYLHSSSELQRISVSASRVTLARCRLDLPPGCRPSTEDTASNASTASSGSSKSSSSSSTSSSSSVDSQQGDAEKEEEKVETKPVIKENGIDVGSNQDLSCVGDITIDSVKDHLANNVNNLSLDERTTSEVIRNETIKVESSLTKTSTTVITSESISSQVVNNVTTPTETESGREDEQQSTPQVRKAPLARMEDMDSDSVPT